MPRKIMGRVTDQQPNGFQDVVANVGDDILFDGSGLTNPFTLCVSSKPAGGVLRYRQGATDRVLAVASDPVLPSDPNSASFDNTAGLYVDLLVQGSNGTYRITWTSGSV